MYKKVIEIWKEEFTTAIEEAENKCAHSSAHNLNKNPSDCYSNPRGKSNLLFTYLKSDKVMKTKSNKQIDIRRAALIELSIKARAYGKNN